MSIDFFKIISNVRKNIISSLVPFESHHIGSSMSIVEILVYLYFKEMNIYPKNPKNLKRDIFILSKGHGALALYSVLYLKGFFDKKIMDTYDVNGGSMPEHASIMIPGVELSTGSLGHGLPVAVGYALSYMRDKKKNNIYVILSDGELNEGSNWEAIMFAGHYKLSNLIVFVDVNNFQGFGKTKDVIDMSPLDKKIKNFGWDVYTVNGNDITKIDKLFSKIKRSKSSKPKIILAKTIKGKGIPSLENKLESHYKSLSVDLKNELLSEYI